MKPRFSNQRSHALTLVEVIFLVGFAAFVLMIFLCVFAAKNHGASRINCVNNLKEIGLAYFVWENEKPDGFQLSIATTNSNTTEIINNSKKFQSVAYLNFLAMSKELSTPKLLHCTADKKRTLAANFGKEFNNSNISYFISLDANTNSPQAFLSGDDNFVIGGVLVRSGLLNLSTNTPIAWTGGTA